MPYQVKFNDTTHINKPFYQAVLEGVYIGKIFNLKIKNYPVSKSITNLFKYAFGKQNLATMTESQIRKVEDYIIVRGKLVKYFQLQLPYMANQSEIEQLRAYNELARFVENVQSHNDIDLFYYDRAEQINDYSMYFEQLDSKISTTSTFTTPEGEQLSARLRHDMNDYLDEMITTYKSRSREAFLVLSADIEGPKTQDVLSAKAELETKIIKTLSILKEMRINFQEVEGKHQEWLFNNFISNTTNY
jgi:hypothetical protein